MPNTFHTASCDNKRDFFDHYFAAAFEYPSFSLSLRRRSAAASGMLVPEPKMAFASAVSALVPAMIV